MIIKNNASHHHINNPFLSINWHAWPYCNYKCVFCFAKFKDLKQQKKTFLNLDEGKQLLKMLADVGMQKITFVGGEPLLSPYISQYIKYSKSLGIITTIVTNGSKLTPQFIKEHAKYLDWVGLSIDSTNDTVEKELGRGNGTHLQHIREIVPILKKYNIKLKINITVTKTILNEDFHDLLSELLPDRIKGFQVLEITEENSGMINHLLITREEFASFKEKHHDLNIVWENNDLMIGSYVMIDAIGRFYHNTNYKLEYSRPILDVGVFEAFKDINFDFEKLKSRGGLYFASAST